MIVINPSDSTFDDTISNAHEIKARGAFVIGISDKENDSLRLLYKNTQGQGVPIPVNRGNSIADSSILFKLKKNVDPDYPRNLAKSVTVK